MTLRTRIGRSACAALVLGAVSIALVACGDDNAPDQTTTVTAATPGQTVTTCPVEPAICSFGLHVAKWAEAGDIGALVAGSPSWDSASGRTTLTGGIAGALGPSPAGVRLAAIGCVPLAGAPDCSKGFALVLAGAGATAESTRGIVVLGFAAAGTAQPKLSGVGVPEGIAERTVVLKGGVPASCRLPAGRPPLTEADECVFVTFAIVP